MERVGKYAFILGILIAVVAGVSEQPWAPAVLAVLGVIVGFLNITADETRSFLLASIALMMTATAMDSIPAVGDAIIPFVSNIVAFIGAAVFVVAIQTLLDVTRD